ncbi:MAG: hypothetical protein E5X43_01430 [Mesorhizobium sp.]|nr:MAG: hypothetical protein E5X43_01430 [Mesorhizobium sp.]
MLGRMPVNHRPAISGSSGRRRSYGGQDRDRRDIWSFSGIWQDFAGIRSHMADGIDGDSSRHGPAYCRNLLLTINVRPFLSNAADTPATGITMWDGNQIEHPTDRLCRRLRATTLSGGMMPFGKIEKSLHEGR